MSIDVNTTFDNVFKSPTADFTTVLMVFVPRRNPRVFDCLHHVTMDNGSPRIDSIEKANIFNEYFASQCQLPDGSNDHPLSPFRYETDERLANITFFPSDIHTILTNLDVNKATGPDKIGNFFT